MDFSTAIATFGVLFLMELGDKTQLAVLSLTARTGRLLAVFMGAALALTLVTLLGVIAGAVMGEFISTWWLSRIAGLAFIAIGGYMLWSSYHQPSEQSTAAKRPPRSQIGSPLGTLGVAFGLLFIAEMGDKTQITVIGMTVKTGSPQAVFLGASLALALVTILAVLAGKMVTRIVPVHWISRGMSLLFILVGALTLSGIY